MFLTIKILLTSYKIIVFIYIALEITVTSYASPVHSLPPQPPSKNVDESNPHGKVPPSKKMPKDPFPRKQK